MLNRAVYVNVTIVSCHNVMVLGKGFFIEMFPHHKSHVNNFKFSVAVGGGGSGAGSAARIEIVEVENSAPSILEFQGHARLNKYYPTLNMMALYIMYSAFASHVHVCVC